MHIQFTRITGSMLLECGWCSGAAVDAAEHARWHWRVEGRSVGDASATGPTYGVGEPLTVAVAAAAPPASGYGGTLREEALDVLGLLLPAQEPGVYAEAREEAALVGADYPFPVPVHAVPAEPDPAELRYRAARSRARVRPGFEELHPLQVRKAIEDELALLGTEPDLSTFLGRQTEAENRAVARYGGAATQAHVWQELRLIDAQRAAE